MTDLPRAEPDLARRRFVCLMLALITLLIYLPVSFHDFIVLDDQVYVSRNPIVSQGLSLAGVQWAFVTWHAGNWHPLTWLSHMLDCQLFGVNPGPQHFVNVLFHVANTIVLFLFLTRATRAFWPGAFVAALFAWHPLHVESVAWLAERKDVLSTLFLGLSLLAYKSYTTHKTYKTYLLSLFWFALGLMAKPMLVTLPFIFLLLDYWPLRRLAIGDWRLAIRRLVLEKWPFFLLSAASCAVTFLAQRQEAVNTLQEYPFGFRLCNVVVSYARYLLKTFWPADLAAMYPLPFRFEAWQVAGAAAMLGAISWLVWRMRRQSPYLLMGWLWFLGTLVPVIGFVQVGIQAMADRYTYIPLLGVFIAVAFGVRDLAARLRIRPALLGVAAGLVLGGCLLRTEIELSYWRDTETLTRRALAVTKDNPYAQLILGCALLEQDRVEEALTPFSEGVRIYHSEIQIEKLVGKAQLAVTYTTLGLAFQMRDRRPEAETQYRKALELDPLNAQAHNNLANLLDETGKTDEALAHYREAERLMPDAPLAHQNLATLLSKLGRFDEAMREYEQALRLKPDDPHVYYLMGKANLRHGRSREAIAAFRKVLALNPGDFQTQTFLARVLATDRDADVRNGAEALALAHQANAATGNQQPLVLDALAMAYAESGRFEDARQTVRRALDLAAVAKQSDMIAEMQPRLKCYEADQPWRDAFTNAPSNSPAP